LHKEKSFTITIIPFTALPNYADQFDCNSYTLLQIQMAVSILEQIKTTYSYTRHHYYKHYIFVYKETTTLNCISKDVYRLHRVSSITPPTNVNSCSAYTLPVLNLGQYRTAPGGGIEVPARTVINATTTLWFYIPGQSCTDNLQFTITVNIVPLPIFTNTAAQCDVYYLPPVAHSGNYFTGPLGTGKKSRRLPITTTQTIYFYDKSAVGPCYVEGNFSLR
jgi:hypothetical protein